jgi:hypothetical protein
LLESLVADGASEPASSENGCRLNINEIRCGQLAVHAKQLTGLPTGFLVVADGVAALLQLLSSVGGPWAAHRQIFQIEVPCNISRRIGVSAGQSRRLTARCHSLENDKTAVQEPLDLRVSWWPGAGSNRRPSDFQA